ncbi:MAG: phosphatidylglycerophosphatase A [Verrucomicrobia bacterium]|nr:phosphatidylglycerophosphatase A [Verrucomicrobiota bacterium]
MKPEEGTRRGVDRWVLWLAQGFGAGRSPVAPGTMGTVVGMAWAVALLQLPSVGWFGGVILGSVAAAVWVCGRAEELMGQKDPGSVVLDEVVAVPICFAGLLWEGTGLDRFQSGWWVTSNGVVTTLSAFALFRLFDIWKPWPIRWSQALPKGWGVVMDDVLAAAFAAVALKIPGWISL